MKHFFTLALLFLSPLPGREYTDVQGRKIEAEFVGFKGNSVQLRLVSGKIASVPLAKLSPSDREYLKTHPGRTLPSVKIDPKSIMGVWNENADVYFIDQNGRKKFDALFKNETPPKFESGAALVDDGRAFMDCEGKLLLNSKDLGLGWIGKRWDDDLIQYWNFEDKAHGFIKHDGAIVIPAQFSLALPMRSGVAWVCRSPRPERGFRMGDPISWELIGMDGKTLVKLPKGSHPEPFSHGHARVTLPEEPRETLFYNTAGKPSFPDKNLPKISSPFIDGFAVVGSGVINTEGEWTVPLDPKRSIVTRGAIIADGVVLARERNGPSESIQVINVATGKSVSSFPAPHGYSLAGSGLISVRSSAPPLLWGCLDRLGNQVIDYQFVDAPLFHNGFSKNRFSERKGEKPKDVVVNTSGKIIYTKPF